MDPQPIPVQPLNYESPTDDGWRTVARIVVAAALAVGVMQLVQSATSLSFGIYRRAVYQSLAGATPRWAYTGMAIEVTTGLLGLAIAIFAFACLRFRPWARRALVRSIVGITLMSELSSLWPRVALGGRALLGFYGLMQLWSMFAIAVVPVMFLALLTRPNIKRVLETRQEVS